MDASQPVESVGGPSAGPTAPKSGGPVIPHTPKWHQRLLSWLSYALIRTVGATLRFRWEDRSGALTQPPRDSFIFCFWHNGLALSTLVHSGYVKKRTSAAGLVGLVSASKDGAFLAAVLERFGLQAVRGSSSRRGSQAMLELASWAERGYDIGITPDGPRGPARVVQPGVMSLAQITGLPILPITFQAHGKIVLRSWDRFVIPLPFARCIVVFEKPIVVPRNSTDEEREQLRQQLERTMREISED